MNYTYDESGIHFIYFLLTILALIVVPFTLKYIQSLFKSKSDPVHSFAICKCSNCQKKSKFINATSKRSSIPLKQKRFWFLMVGWIALIGLVNFLWKHSKIEKPTFDPFEILGITSSSSDKEIRKAYLLLSLKYHPDKVGEEVPREVAQERFVKITKAYKSLTDPVIKSNYELYGNPDGVSTNDVGIALPAWLIDRKNLAIVLSIYCLAFMVALPYWIGKWWKASSKYTKDKVMHLSMALFYRELKEGMNVKKILELLSAAAEFKDELIWRPTDTLAVPALFNTIKPMIEEQSGEKFDLSSKYTAPYAVKAYCLLYAYLHRLDVPLDGGLESDQQFIVQKCLTLINGLIQICLARGWVGCMKSCLATSQLLVQAIPENGHQLLQLPYITQAIGKEFKNRKRNVKSVKEFLSLSNTDRRLAMSHASEPEYEQIVRVAHAFPSVEFSQLVATVLGYDEIVCGSVITLQVRLYLGHIQNSSESMKEQPSATATSTTTSSTPSQPNQQIHNLKFDDDGNLIDENGTERSSDSKSTSSPFIHAPFFYASKVPNWWIIVSDNDGDFVCSPKRISNIPSVEQASMNEKELESFGQLITFQFPAPSKPTTLKYWVTVKGDFSVGFDLQKEIKIQVVAERGPSISYGSGSNESSIGERRKGAKIAEYEGLSDDEDEETLDL